MVFCRSRKYFRVICSKKKRENIETLAKISNFKCKLFFFSIKFWNSGLESSRVELKKICFFHNWLEEKSSNLVYLFGRSQRPASARMTASRRRGVGCRRLRLHPIPTVGLSFQSLWNLRRSQYLIVVSFLFIKKKLVVYGSERDISSDLLLMACCSPSIGKKIHHKKSFFDR